MLKGGSGRTSLGVVWGKLEVLAILKVETQKVATLPPFKRGAQMFCLVLRSGGGWGAKLSDPRFSHFVAPPPRNL